MSNTLSMHPAIPAEINRPLTLDMNMSFAPQVKKWFETSEDLTDIEVTGFPGQGVAAILSLPVFEMTKGLPRHFSLFGFGQQVKVLGELALDNYRHNVVRPRRSEQPEGEAFQGWTVLDGAGRGMETFQLEELAKALGCNVVDIRVINVCVGHIDPAKPEDGDSTKPDEDLVSTLLKSGLTKSDWVSQRILFLPPGLGPLAGVMATAIYGLSEVWPRTIRLNRREDAKYHVDEVVDPQDMRQFGVQLAEKWRQGNAPVAVPRELFNQILNSVPTELAEQLRALITPKTEKAE